MKPIDNYVMFVGIQRYFKGSYDYFKYNGKLKISNSAFKNNEYTCTKLNKKYSPEEFRFLCVSNIIKNPNIWITDLLGDNAEETYNKTKANIISLKYNFKTDLSTLSRYGHFNECLQPQDNQLPISYKLAKMGDIKIETLIILDRLVDLFQEWSKYEDVISGQYLDTWRKYSRFIDIPDVIVYKQLILSSCNFVDKNV